MSLTANLYDDFSNRLARRNRRLAGVVDVAVALTGFGVVGWLLWKGWALYDAAMVDGTFLPLEREGWLYIGWATGICAVALVDNWLGRRQAVF